MTQAEGVHSTECPVAPLVRELSGVLEAYKAHRSRYLDSPRRDDCITRAEADALYARLEALESWAAHHPARSAAGALLHIHLLVLQVGRLQDCVPFGSEHEKAASAHVENIERMCFSLRAYVETVSGVTTDPVISGFYMAREGDPHAALAGALSSRKAD